MSQPVEKFLFSIPFDYIIHPDGKLFSSWGGDLALVHTTTFSDQKIDPTRFKPEKIVRLYTVKRAIFLDTHSPIRASIKFIGEEPILSPDAATFSAGRYVNNDRELKGCFREPEHFWVRQKLGELFPCEVETLQEHLNSRGILDVTDFQLTGHDWRQAFKSTFANTQNLPHDKANEFAKVLNGHPLIDTEAIWDEIRKRGIYGMTKKRNIMKFILRKHREKKGIESEIDE
jgi:hypothetical protein